MTEATALERLVRRERIRITAELTDHNPDIIDPTPGSTHWRVTLRRIDGALSSPPITLHYSQGPAIAGEPTAADVLYCMLSDAQSVADRTFEEWAGDMGWDSDSRKAERAYLACQGERVQLARLLPDALYREACKAAQDY